MNTVEVMVTLAWVVGAEEVAKAAEVVAYSVAVGEMDDEDEGSDGVVTMTALVGGVGGRLGVSDVTLSVTETSKCLVLDNVKPV